MSTFRAASCSLVFILLAAVPLVLAQGTYTQIDYPGAALTVGISINSVGDIVGRYEESNGNNYGFLLSGDTYTSVIYPTSLFTELTGVNDTGQIVGYSVNPYVGFLYDHETQAFTALVPPTGDYVFPFAINNHNEVGGLWYDPTQTGFMLTGSGYSMISPPNASDAAVIAITAAGKLLGVANNKMGKTFSFFLSQGKYTGISIPNLSHYTLTGVNPQGTALVGYYRPSLNVTAGFWYQKNILTPLQFPGSNGTFAIGINRTGEVVGYFYDSMSHVHGFTWTPPAPSQKK